MRSCSLLAGLVPLALAVAACGADAGASTSTSTGPPPEGTAAAAAPDPAAPAAEPERELVGLTGWLNSEPLTIAGELAAGRVVLVDFWTYSCINCIHTLPYLQRWQEAYAERGLVLVGVHTPEFAFEHDRDRVLEAMERLGVAWPVAQDNDWATWRAFENRYWPALYLFGSDGRIVYSHFGEGRYAETEQAIRRELERAGHAVDDVPLASEAALQQR